MKHHTNARLDRIVTHCDALLRTRCIQDWEGAVNGLQVQNNGVVSRIAAAVDASLATIELAVACGADLLLVHHGLFWSESHPWTGHRMKLLRALMDGNLAVYSSHLPLDLHPVLGNNARLGAALGLRRGVPFFVEKGSAIGLRFRVKVTRKDLSQHLENVLGTKPLVVPAGPEVCRTIGIVTGGAGAELRRAAAEGVDTFITGEGPHWTHSSAEELGINLVYGGHYATETFGVKALAMHLSRKFDLPWAFVDHPSGL